MVKIEVFGIREEFPSESGGCGSPNGCDLTLTIGEQYDNLIKFLEHKRISHEVDLSFIDIRNIGKGDFKEIKSMPDVGFSMPYVFINGKIRFFGAIPQKYIYDEISKII